MMYFFSPSVTEVCWEGEECEIMKADSEAMKKTDSTTKKAESNTVANNVKRSKLILLFYTYI